MWAINTSSLKESTNCRTAVVEKYLESDQAKQELNTRIEGQRDGKEKLVIGYNEMMGFSYQHNRGKGSISEVIKLG